MIKVNEMQDSKNEESVIIYFLQLLFKNWKFIFVTNAVIAIITVITLFMIPQWYRSSATVVILEENSSPLSGVLSQISSFGFGLGGGTSVDTYIQYANTKLMYDRLIQEFDLMNVYSTPTKEDAYAAILANLSVRDNENGTFSISFAYEEEPEIAQQIVNFIFEELDQISLEVERAQASNYKNYIERYYFQNTEKLKQFEDSLIAYQTETGILDLNSQLIATISAFAELEKEKVALQIQKNVVSQSLNEPFRIQEIDNQINSINAEIDRLNRNDNITVLSLDNLPQEGADYLRLVRDIEISSQVTEFLRLQYEQAILDEQKIKSDLYLLDPPHIPEKRFKPERKKLLFLVMFASIIVTLIIVRIKDYYSENKKLLHEIVLNSGDKK